MSELRRVMCVEDDADIRMIIEFSLCKLGGYEVLLCPSGKEALRQAVSFAPELILLDVMMPDLNGPEPLAALRELPQVRDVPVVFMTAKAMPDEVEELLHYSVAGVIVKPFDPVKLPRDVRVYWEHSRGRRAH